jgi:hypothetical protein
MCGKGTQKLIEDFTARRTTWSSLLILLSLRLGLVDSKCSYGDAAGEEEYDDHNDIWICSYCGLRSDRHFIKNHIPTCHKRKDKNKEDKDTTMG